MPDVATCEGCDGMGFGYEGKGAAVDCTECDGAGVLVNGQPWPPRPVAQPRAGEGGGEG